jgi:hypothetical protein
MSWLPRSPGSTLVLRLYPETVHDFVSLFLPPCGPHLTPLATGSLEPSLLVFSTPGGLTDDNLSRLFFTCTNTSQATTCTCNTWPRVSPHNIVNHSSHKEATITGPRTTHGPQPSKLTTCKLSRPTIRTTTSRTKPRLTMGTKTSPLSAQTYTGLTCVEGTNWRPERG